MTSEERLRELEDKYDGYTVYDNAGERIGKVDDLFVDESDREEYIGVKMGFFGRKSTLIPTDIVRVDEADKRIEVAESKGRIKDAPSFDDDEDVTPDYEARIRDHFGLEQSGHAPDRRGGYGSSEEADYDDRTESSGDATGDATAETEETGGESAASSPVTRQTEETETFEEGGRTKVRRRIVREEIIEEDV